MEILIGGSGSSGSTLISKILARHDDLFGGGELNFFNKEQFFVDWNKYKKRIFHRFPRISTMGWFPYPGTNLLHNDYGWTKKELVELIYDSNKISDFSENFFRKPVKEKGAKYWVEKTPSNSYCFGLFLDGFSDPRVIHTTRGPLDSVASLVDRGFDPFFATGIWVYNNALGLIASDSDRYYNVNYEDFVNDPLLSLRKITEFLGIIFDEKMLISEVTPGGKINSWKNNSSGSISKSSIGRFKEMDKNVIEEIMVALSLFQISKKHVERYKIKYTNCQEICHKLGFEFSSKIYIRRVPKIKLYRCKDYMSRLSHCFGSGGFNYPAKLARYY